MRRVGMHANARELESDNKKEVAKLKRENKKLTEENKALKDQIDMLTKDNRALLAAGEDKKE